MCITSEKSHLRVAMILLAACLLATAVVAQEIPTDAKGLPLWQVKEWTDFPVSMELRGHEELDALLKSVPIASFNREQIRIIREDAKHYHIIFNPRVTEAEFEALQLQGYKVERTPDLHRQGRQEAERRWAEQYAKGGDSFKYGEKGVWHTHAQVGSILAQVATDHPSLARTFNWGSSVLGRELWGLVISADVNNSSAEPEVRLSNTMHGDEPPGMEMLLFLVDYLTDNYGQTGYEDVTNLVDNYEIHFMPMHNPDGHVAVSRSNNNGIDLNRNFTEPAGTHPTVELENVNYSIYANAHNFVISQNGHSGALVVNYPWDYTYTLAPDDAALQLLSLEFSTYNLPMYNGDFDQGITNGAAWYITTGCVQDWSYDQTDCIDVTIEYHNTKWPSESVIDGLWDENRESLMHFIKAARYGINGVVTSATSGLPLEATVTVVGNDMPVHSSADHGDYYKLLATGTYDVTFEADGYITQTIYGISTTWGTPTVQDVVMQPVAHGEISGTVLDIFGAPVAASIEVRTNPGAAYVTVVQASAVDGSYSVNLVYGDYELIATNAGNTSDSHIVTLDDAAVTVDFTLGVSQEMTLLADDFESGTANWTGDWGLADPADGHDSSNSMTDSPGSGSKYGNYADTACEMAAGVDLATADEAELTFWAKWDIESSWDCVKLQASIDGGTTWDAIGTNRTETGSGQGAQIPSTDPVFDGEQASWAKNTADLSDFLGQSDVRFRFHLSSDSSMTEDGFYFDDFIITATVEVSGVDDAPGLPYARLTAYPNPFNPRTVLKYRLARESDVHLAIYDIQGRFVQTLYDGLAPAGEFSCSWTGRTGTGRQLPSGVYFARLTGPEVSQTAKLMLVK